MSILVPSAAPPAILPTVIEDPIPEPVAAAEPVKAEPVAEQPALSVPAQGAPERSFLMSLSLLAGTIHVALTQKRILPSELARAAGVPDATIHDMLLGLPSALTLKQLFSISQVTGTELVVKLQPR